MSVTVFLHIGLSRTGTTTLQATFSRNAALLRQHGLNYLNAQANHWPLALSFLRQDDFQPLENFVLRGRGTRDDAIAIGKSLKAELEALHRSGVDRILISAEQFKLLTPASAKGLHNFLTQELGRSVVVLLYVRHPVDRLSSLIAQKVRAGNEPLEGFPIADTILPVVRTYEDLFGRENFRIRRFGKRYFEGGDLVDDFFVGLGMPVPPGLDRTPPLNASFSLTGLLIADALNTISPLGSPGRAPNDYLAGVAGPPFQATRAQAERTIEVHCEAMAYLAQNYGITFEPVDLDRFAETLHRPISREAAEAVAFVMNDLRAKQAAPSMPPSKRRPRWRLWSR